jgi:hypothetical protein
VAAERPAPETYPWLTRTEDGAWCAALDCPVVEGERRLTIVQELSEGRLVLPSEAADG